MREPAPLPKELSRAAQERLSGRVHGTGPVSVPILSRRNAHGLEELVHAETGQVLGQCASERVAESTKEFFK